MAYNWMKPFEEVQIGDMAETFWNDGERLKVLDKGTAEDMFKKYGHRTNQSLNDFCIDSEYVITTNCIVLQETPQWDGDVSIYAYDPDGAYVLK